ncbi:hypothetical protein L842_5954 [Mycobacterium intracellulare MIN_052511_1280]|nr:hypothetical protein L842_5954 [Mycobacterium intracellulare MIN_052511_1280]
MNATSHIACNLSLFPSRTLTSLLGFQFAYPPITSIFHGEVAGASVEEPKF